MLTYSTVTLCWIVEVLGYGRLESICYNLNVERQRKKSCLDKKWSCLVFIVDWSVECKSENSEMKSGLDNSIIKFDYAILHKLDTKSVESYMH